MIPGFLTPRIHGERVVLLTIYFDYNVDFPKPAFPRKRCDEADFNQNVDFPYRNPHQRSILLKHYYNFSTNVDFPYRNPLQRSV